MEAKIPETNKKAGVCYALSDEGLELPVIDITHPAFACRISETELSALIDSYVHSSVVYQQASPGMLRAMAEQSRLFRGFVESAEGITSGMATYLNTLGADNLGEGYASPLDRQWAASLTPLTFRLRLQDVARLLADGLAAALAARQGPVHLINLAGGPSMDSLNALILVHKENPELLAGRKIILHVLDIDKEGPDFGARALEALLAEGAPLNGLQASFDAIHYDWSDTSTLRVLLNGLDLQHSVMAGSSAGGLFEYATDEEIVANLKILLDCTPADFVMVGPVAKDMSNVDSRLQIMESSKGRPAIRFIGLRAFSLLAREAGWIVDRTLDGPVHCSVSLMKA